MQPSVVLYLRTDNRALVCVAPPGTELPAVMTADTLQMTVDRQTWKDYDEARQALAPGQDLVVNDDGSTSSAAHTANPAEQSDAILAAFLGNSSPTLAEANQALKVMIRLVRGALT